MKNSLLATAPLYVNAEIRNLPCLMGLKLNYTSHFCKARVLVMTVMVELTVGSIYFSWRDEGCREPHWHDFTLILWATPGWHTNDRKMTQIPLYVHTLATEQWTSEPIWCCYLLESLFPSPTPPRLCSSVQIVFSGCSLDVFMFICNVL